MRLYPRQLLQHTRTNQNGGRFHQLRFNSQSYTPRTPEAIASSTTLHKPKTATSLRKAASASQSIRETQTPTRGAIQPVFTLSTAERYSLPRLQSVLGKEAFVLAESLWVPNLRKSIDGSTGGEAFVFENGCVVSWGVQEEDTRRFIQQNMTGCGVELGKYIEEETEEVEFVTDSSE
jgi:required for meiotic nuclear division protein 1